MNPVPTKLPPRHQLATLQMGKWLAGLKAQGPEAEPNADSWCPDVTRLLLQSSLALCHCFH